MSCLNDSMRVIIFLASSISMFSGSFYSGLKVSIPIILYFTKEQSGQLKNSLIFTLLIICLRLTVEMSVDIFDLTCTSIACLTSFYQLIASIISCSVNKEGRTKTLDVSVNFQVCKCKVNREQDNERSSTQRDSSNETIRFQPRRNSRDVEAATEVHSVKFDFLKSKFIFITDFIKVILFITIITL